MTLGGKPVGELPADSTGQDPCGRVAPRVALIDVSASHSYATKAQSFAAADLAKRGAAVDDSPPVHHGAYASAIDRPDDVMRGRSELTVRKGTAAACLVTLVDSDLSRLPA